MTVCDYLLPDGMSLADAGRALTELLDVRDGRSCVGARSYYDTFDGRLHHAGLLAVWEEDQLALVELGGDRVVARAPASKPTRPVFGSELPRGALRTRLEPLLEDRALLQVVEIRSRERLFDVLDSERKTVVRMRLQQPSLGQLDDTASAPKSEAGRRARRKAVRLRPRIHVAALRGYDKALRRVDRALTGELGLEPTAQPLVDEAVTAGGGRPGGIAPRIEVSLDRRDPASHAAAAVLKALLAVVEANMEGALGDVDSEFLHDLRVSVRRTRAVQRELRHVFEPGSLARFRLDFRWLQQATGDARDLDVYLLEFEQMRLFVPEPLRDDLEPLHGVLARRRAGARRRMARALRSERASSLLVDWRASLELLEGGAGGPAAETPIGEIAGARIAKVYTRMVRMGDAIGPGSAPAEYHELRKQGKELRYLLELFGVPLFPEPVVKPMVSSLKALQEVLGHHQDREVQAAMLRSLSDGVARAADGPAALMAMGVLAEHLEDDQLAARKQFADRFEAFASKRQRKLVGRTFV